MKDIKKMKNNKEIKERKVHRRDGEIIGVTEVTEGDHTLDVMGTETVEDATDLPLEKVEKLKKTLFSHS